MNSRRNFLKTSFVASLGLAAGATAVPAGRPNVLFIFTDDQRFDTIAALGNPHDIFPTVCELAGVDAPAGIDGKSLVSVIRGDQANVRDNLVLAYKDSQRSIRDARWKLIRFTKINRTLLFDLASDPRETRDLAGDPECSGVVKRLMGELAGTLRAYGDNTPLTSKMPIPAEFKPPTKRLKTPYSAGGPAPGE